MFKTYPKPAKDELDRYYESEEYISHTDAKSSITDKLYQWVKKWMLGYKFRSIQQYQTQGRLLDLGAGTGDFLVEANKKGWSISGVEPNAQARNLAKSKGINLNTDLSEISGKFEVITLWHVLEHVYDLDYYLEFLKTHLAENGILIIAVPNFKSYDAIKYGSEWAAYDVPRHLYHFSQKSIQKLFANVDFELIETKPLYFDSFYVSLLSEKYRGSKIQFLRGMLSGLYSNISAWGKKQYSSQIYILKHKKAI
ncbi:MAG TPA: class I SAM-dependent methyltransferase [Leeuwenhoekiella sp.]|nr:class I SAM-dependent methyltransferase [Leeuwenhoekiella sp.]